MTETRRDFLKFVVAGSVAAGCPVNHLLLAAESGPKPQVDGDHFAICHEVRDGQQFDKPAVSSRHDVVIVGGGVSGMSAAYFLRGRDFLLLEKEPHWGGNAYLEEYQGQAFAVGSAFDEKDSASEKLAREIGLIELPIDSGDPTIVAGKWVPDTWLGGLDQLPYSEAVRESFKKFRAEMKALDPEKNAQQLDSVPLTNYLKGYAPEIKQWWDAYGLSNWGAKSEDSSALVAVGDLQDMTADEDVRRTLPGGNHAAREIRGADDRRRDHCVRGPPKRRGVCHFHAGRSAAHRRREIRDHGHAEIHHRAPDSCAARRATRSHDVVPLLPLSRDQHDFRQARLQSRLRQLVPR